MSQCHTLAFQTWSPDMICAPAGLRMSLLDQRLKDKISHKLKTILHGDIDLELMEDYVGCMVLSEKDQSEMTEDLKAFLNDDAAAFATWLTEQLEKRRKKANMWEERYPPMTGHTRDDELCLPKRARCSRLGSLP